MHEDAVSGWVAQYDDRIRIDLLPIRNLGNFVHPTLPVSFGRDSKNRSTLLPGVCFRESKILYTGKWKALSCTNRVVGLDLQTGVALNAAKNAQIIMP